MTGIKLPSCFMPGASCSTSGRGFYAWLLAFSSFLWEPTPKHTYVGPYPDNGVSGEGWPASPPLSRPASIKTAGSWHCPLQKRDARRKEERCWKLRWQMQAMLRASWKLMLWRRRLCRTFRRAQGNSKLLFPFARLSPVVSGQFWHVTGSGDAVSLIMF